VAPGCKSVATTPISDLFSESQLSVSVDLNLFLLKKIDNFLTVDLH
jgi:hypothetical protein